MGNAIDAQTSTVHILHFNDVYNVEEQTSTPGPLGGAARFATAIKSFKAKVEPEETLVLFSGDLLSPSTLSLSTEGSHMIDICNKLHIDCCVVGNHDFDFGVDNLLSCVARSNFPWLNANCFETATMNPLGGLAPCLQLERGGIRFGLIGLVEPDWVDTLAVVDQDALIVKDFCVEARQLARQLRQTHGCQIIIVLTHMRWPNDRRLAAEVPEVDLILGGHDHNCGAEEIKSADGTVRWVIKSGTDFRYFSHIRLHIDSEKLCLKKVDVKLHQIDTNFEPDKEVAELVHELTATSSERLNRVIGRLETDLDGRFAKIRTEETALGNFLTDVALTSVDADCCVLNGGTMRIDAIVPKGDFTLRQLSLILPMLTRIVVLEVSGKDLIDVLENAVSQVPKLEGRFAQVSKIVFRYRADKPKGHRVERDSICVGKKPLVLDQLYRLATTEFLASGKDGFDVLEKKRQLIDEEAAVPLETSVVNYFRTIRILNGFIQPKSEHRLRLIPMKSKQAAIQNWATMLRGKVVDFQATQTESNSESGVTSPTEQATLRWSEITRQKMSRNLTDAVMASSKTEAIPELNKGPNRWNKLRDRFSEKERKRCQVAPKVEGRIIRLDTLE